MCRDLAEILRSRKWPVAVNFGPEFRQQEDFSERILISRDSGGDAILPARGNQKNPRVTGGRGLTCKVEIWAQSNAEGACLEDHADRLEDLVDAFLTALQEWCKTTGASADIFGQISSARPVAFADLGDLSQASGAKYEIMFQLPRGVFRKNGDGTSATTITTPGFQNRTDAYRQAHAEGATASVGCGDE
jgi:hypothetical protein